MDHSGRNGVPIDIGAREEVTLQIVGMNINNARDQPIPIAILTVLAWTFDNVGDFVTFERKASLDHPSGRYDFGFGKLDGHVRLIAVGG